MRLDHLYLDPLHQHRGVGHQVLQWVCAQADRAQLPVELCALKGSEANRFYLRHGFVATGEGDWDIDYMRLPLGPSVRAVRSLWAAFQARDWATARRLLRGDLQVVWWTSGERFDGADAFIGVQAQLPRGLDPALIEAERLEDGRVDVARARRPPAGHILRHLVLPRRRRADHRHRRILGDAGGAAALARAGRAARCRALRPADDPRAFTP